MRCFLFHDWETVEIIGRIHVQRCKRCPKRRNHMASPRNDSRD